MISEYIPTDLSTISKVKNIKNPADLETEIAAISETLKDLSKFRIIIQE